MCRNLILAAVVVASLFGMTPEIQAGDGHEALQITLEAPDSVVLGDDIELVVSVRNTGSGSLEVNELILDEYSVSFRFWDGERRNYVSRLRIDTANPYKTDPRGMPIKMNRLVPGKESLGRREAIEHTFRIPAVQVGNFEIAAIYNPFQSEVSDPLVSEAVSVEIEPQDGNETLAVSLEMAFGNNSGTIVVAYRPDLAFNHVVNMASLVVGGFYDGLTCHRIIPDFMLQGGCPNGNGSGGPGWAIREEFSSEPHVNGVLSMARSSFPDSGGSQFFICFDSRTHTQHLDNNYTVFGATVEGIEVVEAIRAYGSPNGQPRSAVTIRSAELVTR